MELIMKLNYFFHQGMMALIGFNWALPSCIRRIQYGFLEKGFPDDIDTYAMVAGMYEKYLNLIFFLSAFYFVQLSSYFTCFIYFPIYISGYFMCFHHMGVSFGPIIAGIIIGLYSFRVATVFVFLLSCLMFLLNFSTAPTTRKNIDAIDGDNKLQKAVKSDNPN